MIQIDRDTIIQIFGGLMKKPSILNDTDKYNIEITDFSTQFDKFIFSAIYNLFVDGAEEIHTIDIDNYLQSNVIAKNLLEKENGIQFLQDCECYGETTNFNHYYNKLKKINLLRDLQKTGRDISKFYSENELDEHHFEINERFENLKIEDIVISLKTEVANYENRYVLNNIVEESKAVEDIRKLVEDLKKTPEVGVHLQGEIFNTITRGGRKGKLYIRSAGSGVGKALPNNTKIPTPNGWTTVGEVKVGDYLFDRVGKPTKVLAIYPQKEEKRIYKVYFKSGRVAKCCNEHLWSYYDNLNNSNELITSTLQELIDKGLCENGIYKWSVPVCEPVEYETQKEAISPWQVGIILGAKDDRVLDICEEYKDYYLKKDELISSKYFFGDIEQRKNLLCGLLLGNNYLNLSFNHIFTTDNDILKDKVLSLCESLGIICGIERKQNQYTIELKQNFNRDSIIKIEKTDIYTQMTCFYVDNEEHLFLMNDYIVTHNTRSMVGDACNIAYPIRYDNSVGRWVSTGSSGEKVLYTMTEQDPAEIQTMILAYLSGYNEDLFLYGTYNESHMDRINKAIEIMETYQDNMLFARIPDPCSSVVKNLFRRYNYQYGVEIFFYDYIFSSPAMLNEYRDLKLREDVCLRMFTTSLKNLAIELNAFVLTSTQISNDDDKNGGFRDFRNIQGSKSIVNLADFACIMSRPSLEELNMIEGFKNQFNFTPNCVTDVFKNRRGRWTMVRIWSLNDLGTCTKKDLFITSVDMKPINDFQIIDFNNSNQQIEDSIQLILSKYNKNNMDFNQVDELLDRISNVAPPTVSESIKEAFGDIVEEKKRLKNMDWNDYL